MTDRYFDHIVGCLNNVHERAVNGVISEMSDDLVLRSIYMLKGQQARIERMMAAQTPSVVTLDVIRGRKLDVFWLEHRSAGSHPFDIHAVEPVIYYCMDVEGGMCFKYKGGEMRFSQNDYGWFWRCWTARPTPKMQKEVKWQEPDICIDI